MTSKTMIEDEDCTSRLDEDPLPNVSMEPQFALHISLDHWPLEFLEEMQERVETLVHQRKRGRMEESRTSKRRKVGSAETSEETERAVGPFAAEVLRLIAQSGFLRSQDLGKLLLLCSKSFLATLTPAFVYSLLYETRMHDRWASPTHGRNEWVPSSVVEARGHEYILKSMESLPVVKKGIVAVPPVPNTEPALHPHNTVVIVSFWILSQKIYSHQLTPNEMKDLTKSGHCDLNTKESLFRIINLCFQKDKKFPTKLREIRQRTANVAENKNHNIKHKDEDEMQSLVVAKIHGIRLDTNQTCTLYHSNLPRFELQRTHAQQDEIKFPIQRALSNTKVGDQLITQWFHGWPEGIQNFGGLTFGVTLKKDVIHIESIVFGQPGQADHLQTRHGVSPFHIMEGLAGWQ